MNKRRGITLIELMIVLSIMSIISATLVISPSYYEKRKLKSACIQLQNALNYARLLAISEQERTQVLFDTVKGEARVQKLVPGSIATVETVYLPSGVSFDGIVIGKDSRTVIYTEKGTTGDACTIKLKCGGQKAELTVNVGAGHAKIKD